MKNTGNKISFGITIKVLVFIAFVIAFQGYALFNYSTKNSQNLLYEKLKEKGTILAKSIGRSCQNSILVGDYQSIKKLIIGFKKENRISSINIFDSEGNLLATTNKIDLADYTDKTVTKFKKLEIYQNTLNNGEKILVVVSPIYEEFKMGTENSDFSSDESFEIINDAETDEKQSNSQPSASTYNDTNLRKIGVIKLELSMKPIVASYKKIQNRFLRINVIIFLIAFVIVLITANRVIKPLNDIIELLQNITYSNDLTKRVKIPRQKEMKNLANAFNSLIETLSFQIKNTKDVTLSIVNAIEAIRNAASEQEGASKDQVSSVTETITSMAELSHSSKLIDQNSKKVAVFADETLKNAQMGVEAVNKVVESISQIKSKSIDIDETLRRLVEKIELIQQIMNIIEQFTEQTKLIAFNAAIEASTAKEVGRRFAVVAAEVRKLAGDIEKSSHDITHAIKEIQDFSDNTLDASKSGQKEVIKGVKISKEANVEINKIFKSVAQTTDVAKQISIYTSQQISANDDVVSAVKDVLLLAEQSMSNSQQTINAVENLSGLAENLTEMVEKFNI